MGLKAVSPWANHGVSGRTLEDGTIAWLVVTQIVCGLLGGYLAGRLRTKWVGLHGDEVYFRDTAHGLLVWATGMVVTASVLAAAATSLTGKATEVAERGHEAASMTNGTAYVADTLLRSDRRPEPAVREEVRTIIAQSAQSGEVSSDDRSYLVSVVANSTGLGRPEAQQRVDSTIARTKEQAIQAEQKVRQLADEERRMAATFALWLFIALLAGAFSSSVAATLGGEQRDRVIHPTTTRRTENLT